MTRTLRWIAPATAALLLLATCGDDSAVPSTGDPGAAPTTDGTDPPPTVCAREQVEGCTVLGLVFGEPLPLAETLAVAADLGGDAIAVYRTDYVCVPSVDFMPAGDPEPEPSRFAYVTAEAIAERRIEAVHSSLAPPITGWHISQDYWDHWAAEWHAAQLEGVRFEAVAVYLPDTAREDAAGHPQVTAVEIVPWRRTDTIDPSYTGELLLESDGIPGGHLTTPDPLDC
jgi:hypothetical protein